MKGFFSGESRIGSALASVWRAVGKSFRRGFVARCLFSYDAGGEKLHESRTSHIFCGRSSWLRNTYLTARRRISSLFETSLLAGAAENAGNGLMNTSSRCFGSFFLTFGIYSALMYFVKKYAPDSADPSVTDAVAGAVTAVSSLPLLFSSRSLAGLLGGSRLIRWLLTDMMGVPPERLEDRKAKESILASVLFGIAAGTLSYIIPPLKIFGILTLATACAVVLAYPESGMTLLIAAVPFLGLLEHPSRALGGMVLFAVLSFVIKCLRGKRTFSIGLSDIPVCLLWLAVLLSGFPVKSTDSIYSALLMSVLMLGYMMASNLVRGRRMLVFSTGAAVLSAAVISALGILQYAAGLAPYGWMDESLYSGITGRAVALFDNPNMLGFYLVPAFPAALSLMQKKNTRGVRCLGLVSALLIAACSVLTWSRSAWLGLCAGAVVFALLTGPRAALVIPIGAIGAAAGCVSAPSSFGARLSNIASLGDSANMYRRRVWEGVMLMLRRIRFYGAGAGNSAFASVYMDYAVQGTETAPHAHSLYLQLTAQSGLIATVLLIASFVLLLGKTASSLKNRPGDCAVYGAAFMSGVAGLMVSGIFDYIWYNYSILFVFWYNFGLASAAANAGKHEKRLQQLPENESPEAASAEIFITRREP